MVLIREEIRINGQAPRQIHRLKIQSTNQTWLILTESSPEQRTYRQALDCESLIANTTLQPILKTRQSWWYSLILSYRSPKPLRSNDWRNLAPNVGYVVCEETWTDAEGIERSSTRAWVSSKRLSTQNVATRGHRRPVIAGILKNTSWLKNVTAMTIPIGILATGMACKDSMR